jgi:KRAB domain-containing zinc finger protein
VKIKKPKLICFSIYLLQNEPIMLEKSKFACPFCPKLMPKHSTMKIHIRKHTGEKPYSCNQCNKSYSTNSNLNVHIRDVHGNSPSLKKSEIFQSY